MAFLANLSQGTQWNTIIQPAILLGGTEVSGKFVKKRHTVVGFEISVLMFPLEPYTITSQLFTLNNIIIIQRGFYE